MDGTFDEFSDWSGLEIRLVYYPLVSQQIPSNRAMLVIVAEKMEWRLANMLAGRSSVRFAYDLERPTSKHFFRGRKLPDRCHRAKTRNEGNQQATHSLGKTAVLRYTHHAKTPTRQVGFSLPKRPRDWLYNGTRILFLAARSG